MKVILASKSPRRKELLGTIIKDFDIVESNFDEEEIKFNKPKKLVEALSRGKCEAVFNSTDGIRCVIGADTIVSIGSKILGKPKNKIEAKEMLYLLNDTIHNVYTGVSIMIFDGEITSKISFCTKSEVYFRKLSEDEIEGYVNTEEPMDKAGGYAIQGLAGKFVKKIKGSFHNIIGLPIAQLYEVLKKENIV